MAFLIKDSGKGAKVDGFWWEAKDGCKHEILWPLVEKLRMNDSARRERLLMYMRMYGNYAGAVWSRNGTQLDASRLRYNLIGQAIDTVISEVTFQDPKAAFMVDGGDWTLRQAAKAREGLVEAQMRDQRMFAGLGKLVLRDSAIIGLGELYGWVDWRTLSPRLERVLPLENLWDEADARAGNPRQRFRVRPFDRGVLAGAFPEHAKEILDRARTPRWVPTEIEEWLVQDAQDSDLVLVAEAWHLPSYKDADDGWHVVALPSLTLHEKRYKRDRFPFASAQWKPDLCGVHGIGLAQDLQADQVELNRVLMAIQATVGAAAGMWLLQKGSGVKAAHMTDIPGACIEFTGLKPEWVQPNTLPQDLLAHAERIIARGLSRAGINEMAATGTKPSGLASGEAIRSYRDQFSLRQSPHAQVYEQLYLDTSQLLVDLNQEIYEALKSGEVKDKTVPEVSVEVRRGRKKVLKRMRWEEADMPENACVLKAYPVNALGSHPASRMDTLKEWADAGLVTPDEVRFLAELPDTQGHLELKLADYDYALWAFETMTEDGKYAPPSPYQRLDLALELMRLACLRAEIDGCPDERLDLVRDHMNEIKALQDKAKAADAAANPAPVNALAAPPVDPMMLPPGAAAPMPAPELAGLTETTPIGAAA